MELFFVWVSLFVPDVGRLGADEWREREAEHRRLDNPLSALLLPPRHCEPEVDYRVKAIRTKQLKLLNPVYVERLIFREDFDRWVTLYLEARRSRIIATPEFYRDEVIGRPLGNGLRRRYPENWSSQWHLWPEFPADFDEYVRWLERHNLAPHPREK